MSSPDGPRFRSGLLSGAASPSGEDGFFPFVLERRESFLGGGPGPDEPEDLALQLQQKEKDLLLAAELGKMLLERNEELRRQLETLSAQHAEHEEVSRLLGLGRGQVENRQAWGGQEKGTRQAEERRAWGRWVGRRMPLNSPVVKNKTSRLGYSICLVRPWFGSSALKR